MRSQQTDDFDPTDPVFVSGQKEYAARIAIRDLIDAGESERVCEILLEEIARMVRQ